MAEKITLIGAGPVGSLLAIYLARRGHEVEIFERRPDMRVETISAGRSINLAMSVRGIHALAQVGLDQAALAEAVPMYGRMMHAVSGELAFQPYGRNDSDCIYSISRGGLNKLLMTAAERTGRVAIRFNRRALGADWRQGTVEIEGEGKLPFTRLLATDGSASAIRESILVESHGRQTQDLLDYGYKELQLPARADGGYGLERPHALHIWPRGNQMLIALPNFDGSFTCTLFLPFEGEESFARLTAPAEVRAFFGRHFPDVATLFPALERDFFEHPTGQMVTVRAAPWNAGGRGLLVGDAAHAIVPFFGQGMNCGFEDCAILDELLETEAEWEAVFERFSRTRKPDADAIAELAIENFVEMRDRVGDPRFLLEKQLERILQREFPDAYVSRYSMVTFSRVPYREAQAAGAAQSRILAELSQGLRDPGELDLARAKKLIAERITGRPSSG